MTVFACLVTIMVRETGVRWREWSAFAAIVLATSVVIGLSLTGIRSAGDAPPPLGGIVRSWTTPAAFLSIVAGAACLAAISRLIQSQFDSTRQAWVALGILPWQGRGLIVVQTLFVAASATGAGIVLVVLATTTWGSITVPWGVLHLTTGPIVVVGTVSATAVSTVPAVVSAAKTFPHRRPRSAVFRGVAGAVLTAACVIIVTVAPSDPTSPDKIQASVPWSLLLVLLGSVTASTLSPMAWSLIAQGLDHAFASRPWSALRFALRAAALAAGRDGAGIALPLVGVAVPGGLAAVFISGDVALRHAESIGPGESTIDWPAVLSLGVAPATLAALAGVLAFTLSGPVRRQTGHALIAAGATTRSVWAIASLEASIIWAFGTLSALAVVGLSALPLMSGTKAGYDIWATVVLNPVVASSSCVSLVALLIGAALSRRS